MKFCAMPDSGKYPHDKQVADPFAGTCAVAAKWNIDVGLKPLSKCNMPAPPATSLALMLRARAWEWDKDPSSQEGGQGSRKICVI